MDLPIALHIGLLPAPENEDLVALSGVLDSRAVSFEWDGDMSEVVELEYVLECFDKMERTSLEQEIRNAK